MKPINILIFSCLALSACVPSTPVEKKPRPQTDTSAKAAWVPLNYNQIKNLTFGFSYRVSNKNSDGSVYYIGDNGRFLIFDPTEGIYPPEYFDGGNSFKKVNPDHTVGRVKSAVDMICTKYELTGRRIRLCHSFIQKNDVVYLYGDKNLPLEFYKGYGPMAEHIVNRAGGMGHTKLLDQLRRELPNYSAAAMAYKKANNHDRLVAQIVASRNAKQAAAKKQSSTSNNGGGLIGWALRTGINTLKDAGSNSTLSTNNTQPVQPTSNSGKHQKGIKEVIQKGSDTIFVCADGRKRKVHRTPYGQCEMPSTFGSFPCDYALKQTKKSCF
jgi:hypothetical protein